MDVSSSCVSFSGYGSGPDMPGRFSVTFHLMCVLSIFSSVWVDEWPHFGKELLIRLTKCSFAF